MTAGRFITLDGPGGVGKSTTVAALAALLRDRGEDVHTTTEPSSSPLGQFTRGHADQISGHALACLVAADRYEHIRTEIQPRLDAGDTVVCDRYLAPTLVVQRLDGVPERFLLDLNADIVLPDAAVLLTADPKTIGRPAHRPRRAPPVRAGPQHPGARGRALPPRGRRTRTVGRTGCQHQHQCGHPRGGCCANPRLAGVRPR